MKKIVVSFICILILLGVYFGFFGHRKINLRDVEVITINSTHYTMNNDSGAINDIVSMYNEAPLFRKDVATTPCCLITIELKNGSKIEIDRTTQGFHYVNEGRKNYRIASTKLSNYLRNLK